ncbi:MAG: hypothetical protein WA628_05195 [Terriglobales bacterium]
MRIALRSVLYRMGVAESKLKHYDQVIAAFRKQVENIGEDFDSETGLADAYRAKGMLSEAEEAARRAENLKPSK